MAILFGYNKRNFFGRKFRLLWKLNIYFRKFSLKRGYKQQCIFTSCNKKLAKLIAWQIWFTPYFDFNSPPSVTLFSPVANIKKSFIQIAIALEGGAIGHVRCMLNEIFNVNSRCYLIASKTTSTVEKLNPKGKNSNNNKSKGQQRWWYEWVVPTNVGIFDKKNTFHRE